jgi:hypothetical protein
MVWVKAHSMMVRARSSVFVTRLIKPAAAVAVTGGSAVYFLSHEPVMEQQQQQPTSLLATSTSTSSSGALSGFLSGFGTRRKDAPSSKIKRQSTMELMHSTANLNSVERKYKVEWDHPIGKGTFGDVFYGKNKQTGERVAIKKISKKVSMFCFSRG